MSARRDTFRAGSNNPDDPNRNWCGLMVAEALGVERKVKYLHTVNDLVRATRAGGYTARSRRSAVRGDTVGSVRAQLADKVGATFYIVHVDGHVLLLGASGHTLIDSDPRKNDRRKIRSLYGVWK
jgi:hypothetical protein